MIFHEQGPPVNNGNNFLVDLIREYTVILNYQVWPSKNELLSVWTYFVHKLESNLPLISELDYLINHKKRKNDRQSYSQNDFQRNIQFFEVQNSKQIWNIFWRNPIATNIQKCSNLNDRLFEHSCFIGLI